MRSVTGNGRVLLVAVLLAVISLGCALPRLPWDVTGSASGAKGVTASNSPNVTGNTTGGEKVVTGKPRSVADSVTGNGFGTAVTVHGLRVRVCPALDCAVVGFLQAGDALTVTEVVRAGGTVWGRHAAGWSALCWQGKPRVSGGCER